MLNLDNYKKSTIRSEYGKLSFLVNGNVAILGGLVKSGKSWYIANVVRELSKKDANTKVFMNEELESIYSLRIIGDSNIEDLTGKITLESIENRGENLDDLFDLLVEGTKDHDVIIVDTVLIKFIDDLANKLKNVKNKKFILATQLNKDLYNDINESSSRQ